MNFIEKLKFMIEFEEGSAGYAYDDTSGIRVRAPVGNVTIGVGHNLDAKELSKEVIQKILEEDLEEVLETTYNIFPTMEELSENRQLAILDMNFQLGPAGFLSFKKFREAIIDRRWDDAAKEIENSKYYKQAPARATRKMTMITGNIFPYGS